MHQSIQITPRITGSKKQSEERAALYAVRVYAIVVCRAWHVFLRVSRAYHESGKIGKSQTQPGSGEGCSGCARGHFALARDAPRGSRPAEAGYRERMGRRTEIELGGSGGTNPQHRTKSPNCHRPGTYTRRSCAERRVFTPGDLPCCPGPSRARGIDWGFE
jgi:hypothetical protein